MSATLPSGVRLKTNENPRVAMILRQVCSPIPLVACGKLPQRVKKINPIAILRKLTKLPQSNTILKSTKLKEETVLLVTIVLSCKGKLYDAFSYYATLSTWGHAIVKCAMTS
jgi:hypothetical protein